MRRNIFLTHLIDRLGFCHERAVEPGYGRALFVAGPYLLSSPRNHPLGHAVLAGHVHAAGDLEKSRDFKTFFGEGAYPLDVHIHQLLVDLLLGEVGALPGDVLALSDDLRLLVLHLLHVQAAFRVRHQLAGRYRHLLAHPLGLLLAHL